MAHPFRFVLLLFAAGLLQAQSNYFLPLIADGPGVAANLKSTIVLANTGAAVAQVRLTVTRDDSSPLPLSFSTLGTGSSFSLNLKPGATRVLETDGSGDGSYGAVRIVADKSVRVIWSVSSIDGSGNLSSGAGLAAPGSASEFLVPVDVTSGVVSGAAVFNPNPAAVTLNLRFLDAQGQPLESASANLGAGQRFNLFAADQFPDLAGASGTLDIVSTTPVAVTAVRVFAAARILGVLPAAARTAFQLRHYLPAIVDGPSASGTAKTMFLLTNAGRNPVAASLTLTLDDGSPMKLVLGGSTDSSSTFQTSIAAGATLAWQTSGSGDYQAGAATIAADGPLNVSAVVTVFDDQGNPVAESAAPESAIRARFAIPFDTTAGGVLPSFLLFNPAGAPIGPMLTLYDPDGTLVSSVQTPPLAPGARLQANFADYFPNATLASGSVLVDTGSPLGGSFAALALRQPAGALPFSGWAGAEASWIGSPIDVRPTLDSAHKATSTIGRAGGKLQLSDAAGNTFTLTLPPNAINNGAQTITMTAIASAAGVPGKGLVAGVQLDPDGLILAQPATLAIQTRAALPDTAVPIGWHGAGHGLYLNLQQPDSAVAVLWINHFSSAGMADMSPADLTAALLRIGDQIDLENSIIAHWILQAHYAIQHHQDPAPFFALANNEYLTMFDMAIQSLLELGQDTQNPDVLRCAMEQARAFLVRGAALRLFGTGNAAADTLRASILASIDAANTAYETVIAQHCTDTHDFLSGSELLLLAQQEYAAGHYDVGQRLFDTATKCPPTLEMDFSSTLSGTVVPDPQGGGTYTGTISARVPLAGALTKEALTSIQNPGQDLFTSFTFSGSAPETYDSAKASAICTITFPALKPDTFNIISSRSTQITRIVYTFLLTFNPTPLLRNGEQLCEFCPIYQKKPLDVEMLIDPGAPSEMMTALCGAGAPPLTLSTQLWLSLWKLQHQVPGTDLGFINGWDLPDNGVPLARKSISAKIPGPTGASGTETTTFTLVNPPLIVTQH